MSAQAWIADRLVHVGTLAPKHSSEINDLVWVTGADVSVSSYQYCHAERLYRQAFITCSEDMTLRLWAEETDGTYVQRALQQIDVEPCALTWDAARQSVSCARAMARGVSER